MQTFTLIPTLHGQFGFVRDRSGLLATFLPFGGSAEKEIARHWPDAQPSQNPWPRFGEAIKSYFNGRRVSFNVRLSLDHLTPFTRSVLLACSAVSHGSTVSYAELARLAGHPGAARAVGQAMAGNRLPLVVPCHRVICSDGSLGGFSSKRGLDDKRLMLRLESGQACGEDDEPRTLFRGQPDFLTAV